MHRATPAMSNNTTLPFGFPAVGRKKLIAAFDGGRITTDGGVLLLGAVERQLGLATRLAQLIADPRNPALVTHSVDDILRARILAIACGYEDADDLDHLRTDPAFKLACHRLPDSGGDRCSQPTVSRWENAPSLREVVRRTYAMVDLYCASYARPPAVTLDLHWPDTRLTLRGDSHYGRPAVMAWCEANGLDYIFGRSGNAGLDRLVEPVAAAVRVRRALTQAPAVRRYTEIRYGAQSWHGERRVVARIEATPQGLDIRYLVTNLRRGAAEWLYATMDCGRGAAENLIKLHKGQLASDRTSCRDPLANQVRLILHTAAYWRLLCVRDAIPRPQPLATAAFATLRLHLIKIGTCITETATRVRIAFTAACPAADLFAALVRGCLPARP